MGFFVCAPSMHNSAGVNVPYVEDVPGRKAGAGPISADRDRQRPGQKRPSSGPVQMTVAGPRVMSSHPRIDRLVRALDTRFEQLSAPEAGPMTVLLSRRRRVRGPDVAIQFPLAVRALPDNNVISRIVYLASFSGDRVFINVVF